MLCGASAVGGLLADGAPTGLAGFDTALIALFAATLPLVASRAQRSAWAVAAGVAVVPASRDPVLFACALVTFGGAVAAYRAKERNRIVGAAIGAALAQLLLRFEAWGPNGATALVGVIATGVLLVSAVRSTRGESRSPILIGAVIVGGFALLLTAAFGVNLLISRSDLQSGIDVAQAGVDAARRGNTERAIERFDEASRLLSSAARQLDAPYSRAARIVPIVGQHEAALRTLVRDAADLAAIGAIAAREANVDALRLTDGRLDPARVAALRAPLARVSRALAVTTRDLRGVRSPWFVGPMQHGVERLTSSVRRATHDAATASIAVAASPRLLGTDRPATYFVMFVTPSEARASGGLLGNFAILTVDDGKFEMSEFGRASDLNAAGDPATKQLQGLTDYLARYGQFDPAHEWRSVNMSPDFPSVAEAVRQLYPQSGGTPIDGVISLDPTGLAALLKLTGPVQVEGIEHPLTAKNAAQFLLKDQYVSFGDNDQRIDFLEEAAHTVTDRLLHATLPGLRVIGRTLGPAGRGGHLRAAFFDPQAAQLFERLGVARELRATAGDTFGLVTQNSSGNKIEMFLHRSVRLETSVDPRTGRTASTAVIRLRNDAPTSGLPDHVIGNLVPGMPKGWSRLYLSVYSTLGITSATLEGAPVTLDAATENGLTVASTLVTVPAGEEVTLRVELAGANRFVARHGQVEYGLDLWQQTMVNPDKVAVRVQLPSQWHFTDTGSELTARGSRATYTGSPARELRLSAAIEG